MWGYPATALLFVAASFGIVANQVWSQPGESALGLGFVLLGVPVYWLWARTERNPGTGDTA